MRRAKAWRRKNGNADLRIVTTSRPFLILTRPTRRKIDMIPREILKKIRQIEMRTNRFVKISLSAFQLFRVMARMEYGQNHNAFLFDEEVNDKWKAAGHDR